MKKSLISLLLMALTLTAVAAEPARNPAADSAEKRIALEGGLNPDQSSVDEQVTSFVKFRRVKSA